MNARSKKNLTALLIALAKKDIDAINVLLKSGADPNIMVGAALNATDRARTALQMACHWGNLSAIKILLNAGADPNIMVGGDVNTTNRKGTVLITACQQRNMDVIKLLLNAGADPNLADSVGRAPIHHAIIGGKDVLQVIIEHGADVNATNRNDETALTVACRVGNINAINVLLNTGADPNNADSAGRTPIHHAITGGCSKEVIQVLIDHGADVNARDIKNATALWNACSKGNDDVINVLLNAGADANPVEVGGHTCLHAAVMGRCSKDILQAVVDHGADVNATNKGNASALSIACCYGDADAIKILLKAGADTNNAEVDDGNTCLHNAVFTSCSKESLQAIIDHGADVNTTNNKGATALVIACLKGHLDAIRVLLNAGADLNITDTNGYTCLHIAADGYCSKQVLQTVIDYGAALNVTNKMNESPLIVACQRGNADAEHVLLNNGADPNVADAEGNTWLHHAAVAGNCSKQVLQAVIDYGADVNTTNKINISPLIYACGMGNADVIKVLLKTGADTKITTGFNGNTCLHDAVIGSCNQETVQAIIDHGADMNATNKNNVTALIIACQRGNADAINVFLNAGADPSIADAGGNMCLHFAVKATCSTETLQAIIDHGADVNVANKDNVTALMIACQTGNASAINVLLNAGADPNISGFEAFTCLHYAVLGGCSKDALQTVINNGADVNATDKKNRSALNLACDIGNVDVIDVLLKAGADTNICEAFNGNTCLHDAVIASCSQETLKAIIDHGADMNAANKNGATALIIACQERIISAINVLLQAGGDPNIADSVNSATPLHYAIDGGCSKEVFQKIIDHGADVDAVDSDGRTALMIASLKGNVDAITILLNAGADLSISDVYGKTSIHMVKPGSCSKDALQTIVDRGADVNAKSIENVTALMIACKKGNMSATNVLLHAGADPNIADSLHSATSLHYAIAGGCSREVLQKIIDHGADVDAARSDGTTALLLACYVAHKESVNVLLRAEADSTFADADGNTCLHNTLHGEYDQGILQMVIDYGVPVNATNKKHQTAYMLAENQGNIDAMFALLNAGADPNIIVSDCDATFHHTDDGCAINGALQTIMKWLLPEITTESVIFSPSPHILYCELKETICNEILRIIF